ncbi:MAG: DUF4203 domain-containing protein [Cellulomonas sp.]|nr:DUF4203 domain-containing protein [Cellulomonas sp.]
MPELVVGLLAMLVGTLLCFRGYAAMRLVIGLFGAWVGFVVGARLVADAAGGSALAGVPGWVGALVGAFVLGMLAYLSYQVAVVLGFAAFGYTVAASAMTALGVQTGWVVQAVAVVAGIGLGVLAIRGNLPAVVLVVLTALAGASVTVNGVMLLVGASTVADLGQVTQGGVPSGWWFALDGALVLLGLVVQSRSLSRSRRTMSAQWHGAPAGRAD